MPSLFKAIFGIEDDDTEVVTEEVQPNSYYDCDYDERYSSAQYDMQTATVPNDYDYVQDDTSNALLEADYAAQADAEAWAAEQARNNSYYDYDNINNVSYYHFLEGDNDGNGLNDYKENDFDGNGWDDNYDWFGGDDVWQ